MGWAGEGPLMMMPDYARCFKGGPCAGSKFSKQKMGKRSTFERENCFYEEIQQAVENEGWDLKNLILGLRGRLGVQPQ